MGIGSLGQSYVTSRTRLGEFAGCTPRQNRMVLRRFAEFVGRDTPVADLKRRHVERWLESLDVSPNTKRGYLSNLKAFFAWAVEHDHIPVSPAAKVKGPTPQPPIPRALPAVDITRVLALLESDRARLIVLFMAQEAMRACEVAGIRRENLDLADWLVTITGQGAKQRTVPVSEETRDVVCRYLLEHPGATGPLLRSEINPRKGISAQYVSKLAAQYMEEAGVKFAPYDGRSGHALRHSAASHMLENGADIREVGEYLGHASLTSTQVYLRRLRAAGPLRVAAAGRTYMPSPLGAVVDDVELSA